MGIHVNPLVDWVWAGFGLLATAAVLLLSMCLWPSTLLAQQTVPVDQKSPLQRQVENEIMCTCGCRQPVGSCGMLNCPGHSSQEAKLASFLAEGKDHDQIIAAFVKDYGSQEVLTAPIDKGFNRLAWLVPYLVGFAGLVGIVWTVRRRSSDPSAAGDAGIDPTLSARLDDELRHLD
jgi:cytochrome c-type biogenesis protein CcmH/NrfF